MKSLLTLLVFLALQILCNAGSPGAAEFRPIAFAIPISGITIDGKLDDWPKDMFSYPILNNGRFYGPTDLDDADLTTSPDLSPSFMVGYSAGKNLIYLAVRVSDDFLKVTMQDPWHTDACEVYVDGSNTGKTLPSRDYAGIEASKLPALQYVLCPPGGGYGPNSQNPSMFGGDTTTTKTRGVCARTGDITTYEWAIEAFDKYPDTPTKLVYRKTIGFDVVVVDKDSDTDTPAWICWGPIFGLKFLNADMLGKLVLLKSYAALGTLSGVVKKAKEGTVYPGLSIEIYQNDNLVGEAITDARGIFHYKLLPGKYTVKPRQSQGIEPVKEVMYVVVAGKEAVVNFNVTPLSKSR